MVCFSAKEIQGSLESHSPINFEGIHSCCVQTTVKRSFAQSIKLEKRHSCGRCIQVRDAFKGVQSS